MSRYCWERGTIKLPSAAVVPLKTALREAANKHHEQVLEYCKKFWTDVAKKTRSNDKYDEVLRSLWYDPNLIRGYSDQVQSDARNILSQITVQDWQTKTRPNPRQVVVKDVETYAKKYTNRDTVFDFVDGTISFDGNNVTWSVPENNHADEHARRHPLAVLFFDYLNTKVIWTRGSGGQIVGNDEYNRDDREYGGGGNYVVESWPKPKPKPLAYSGYGYRYGRGY